MMGPREIWEVFTDLHNEIEEIVEVDDETVVSVQRTHARMRHVPNSPRIQSGRPFGDSRTEKVWRGEGYWTRTEALKAAGLEE